MPKKKRHVLKHLGDGRMVPNSYIGRPITQKQATEMIGTCADRKLPKGLKFDTNYTSFDITKWTLHNKFDKPKKYLLLPKNASKETIGSIVYTGCYNTNNNDRLDLIMNAAILIDKYYTNTRTEDGSDGYMSSWSQNISHGKQTQAAINAKGSDKQRIKGELNTILSQCKDTFIQQFINKSVGFEELLEDLKQVFYQLKNAPLCYIASSNLSNSEHIDTGDHSRSFAFWVTENNYEGAYLLFPQWGLAIKLCHGRYISWSGKECAHCSSIPKILDNNNKRNIYSLFTAIPNSLYNETMKTRRCDKVLKQRHKKGWSKTNTSLFQSINVGMKVQIRVIPSFMYKKLQNDPSNQELRKLIKKYHYYQTNIIMKITPKNIELKRVFAKTLWKKSRRNTWINLVVDKQK